MTHCHICERETETYGEMDPGKGVVLKCCVCKAPARLAAPSPPPSAALAIVPTVPRPPRIVEAPAPVGAPLTASALLAAAAARRAAVGAALAEMASLQAEALILDRILAAAEPLN